MRRSAASYRASSKGGGRGGYALEKNPRMWRKKKGGRFYFYIRWMDVLLTYRSEKPEQGVDSTGICAQPSVYVRGTVHSKELELELELLGPPSLSLCKATYYAKDLYWIPRRRRLLYCTVRRTTVLYVSFRFVSFRTVCMCTAPTGRNSHGPMLRAHTSNCRLKDHDVVEFRFPMGSIPKGWWWQRIGGSMSRVSTEEIEGLWNCDPPHTVPAYGTYQPTKKTSKNPAETLISNE